MKVVLSDLDGISILVTGGTGSIGSVVVEKILREYKKVRKIYVLGRSELKHDRLKKRLSIIPESYKIVQAVGDIRDYQTVLGLTSQCDVVIHTAAMKYVPYCEENVCETIQTNLIGTRNVRDACLESSVCQLVAVSTDKAANAKGVMGRTKWLQERMLLSERIPYVNVSVVRFGNVLGSEGSVVWRFKEQIQRGEALTITDLSMKRYVMSLQEAANFVLWAVDSAPSMSLAVKKMKSCTILDLAEAVANWTPFKYDVVGIRPGEKVEESLFDDEEESKVRVISTPIGDVGVICDEKVKLETERALLPGDFSVSRNLIGVDEIRQMLKESGVL